MVTIIRRTASDKIIQLSHSFPAVAIIGPRQSGKTTLVRNIFPEKPYVLLEDPDTRQFAMEDPRSFLLQYEEKGAVFDEIQHVPILFSYLQGICDSSDIPGRFILTGSQNFLLMEKISQSLAGRIGIIHLLPLSMEEINSSGINISRYEDLLYQGFFPRLYKDTIIPTDFYASYVQTYLERDLRYLKLVQNLSTFQIFIRICANRIGQVVNFTSLGSDCGISHNTAREWLSLLETSSIIFFIRTHHKNFNKRLIRMPKLYFTDTGLAAYLIGIRNPDQIIDHPLKGGLFENLIISELLKYRFNHGLDNNLYYWRDKTGHEIDCIIDRLGTELIPVEIKAGRTIAGDFFKNIQYFNKLSGQTPERSFIVYGGDKHQKRAAGQVVSYMDLKSIYELL